MFSPRNVLSRPVKGRDLPSYPVGWYGDNGLGEELIQEILAGRKTATLGPAYDPFEHRVGETLQLADKTGRSRAVIRITAVEFLGLDALSSSHMAKLGLTLEQIKTYLPKYIARELRADEELRITSFELVR